MIALGIIGCGHVGRRHVRAAIDSGRFRLIALCDVNPEHLLLAAESLSRLEMCTSHYSDLVQAGVQAVAICTPHDLHAEIATFFVRRGVHVLVEKPLALSASDGAELTRLGKQHDALIFVAMQRRFLPHLSAIRTAYRRGDLGALLHAESSLFWSRDRTYYSESPWRGRLFAERGVLYTMGCHFMDALGYTTEFPRDCIACCTRRLRHDHEIDDTGSAIFAMPNGSLFSLNWSTCAHPKGQIGTLTLVLECSTIVLGGRFLEEVLLLEDGGGAASRAVSEMRTAAHSGGVGKEDLHRALYEALGDRLLSGRIDDRLCEAVDGTSVLRLIENAYSTARVAGSDSVAYARE